MKIVIFLFSVFLISCGSSNFQNNYYIDKVEGFSDRENQVIQEVIAEIKEEKPEVFSGSKPLVITKTSEADFGEIDYREFYCQIRLNPDLTTIFLEDLALKYLVLHQIGRCFRLPLSLDQEDIMFYEFNSFLIPKISEKIPDFAKKL